jgi:hypothetical protein
MDRRDPKRLVPLQTPAAVQNIITRYSHATTVRLGADGRATVTVHSHGKLDSSYGGPSLMTLSGDTLTAAAWHSAGRVVTAWTPGQTFDELDLNRLRKKEDRPRYSSMRQGWLRT